MSESQYICINVPAERMKNLEDFLIQLWSDEISFLMKSRKFKDAAAALYAMQSNQNEFNKQYEKPE
jgi:hypothetical protein